MLRYEVRMYGFMFAWCSDGAIGSIARRRGWVVACPACLYVPDLGFVTAPIFYKQDLCFGGVSKWGKRSCLEVSDGWDEAMASAVSKAFTHVMAFDCYWPKISSSETLLS